ncbi:MAG TPA: class I SAM-dependent methyltransferase [Candidatus Doudnabacteria bacterium]|nr:class I SAM-dependent methyltransferase [Candidatus Doudnabacteria bacterium]
MKLESFKNFLDFELLDSGNGYRLERWGNINLKRPDPQIIWQPSLPQNEWDNIDGEFVGSGERGRWNKKPGLATKWEVYFRPDIKFIAKLTPFKHTGIFAEQAANWEWFTELTKNSQPLRILNLFAYTGGATMVLTRLGHSVTHVDASKPAIAWAKENQALNKFPPESIRWILDDALKFAQRELKRGQRYDGIIMDPPAFGHSPTGKTWKFNRDLPILLDTCVNLLSDNAKFLLINGYATNASALSLNNLVEDAFAERGGKIEAGEITLRHQIKSPQNKDVSYREISTGIFARWQN